MALALGTKTEITNLLKEYLASAESGEFDAIAIIGYNKDSHSKNVIFTNDTNGVGLLGGLQLLLQATTAACLAIEAQQTANATQLQDSLNTDPNEAN
jgi:hypothetical protein